MNLWNVHKPKINFIQNSSTWIFFGNEQTKHIWIWICGRMHTSVQSSQETMMAEWHVPGHRRHDCIMGWDNNGHLPSRSSWWLPERIWSLCETECWSALTFGLFFLCSYNCAICKCTTQIASSGISGPFFVFIQGEPGNPGWPGKVGDQVNAFCPFAQFCLLQVKPFVLCLWPDPFQKWVSFCLSIIVFIINA